jgi:hypothetical protein
MALGPGAIAQSPCGRSSTAGFPVVVGGSEREGEPSRKRANEGPATTLPWAHAPLSPVPDVGGGDRALDPICQSKMTRRGERKAREQCVSPREEKHKPPPSWRWGSALQELHVLLLLKGQERIDSVREGSGEGGLATALLQRTALVVLPGSIPFLLCGGPLAAWHWSS